jgi:hypothetical protein
MPRPAPWRLARSASRRWSTRPRGWPACAGRQVAERKVAVVLYGFPPNAGAAGTAAYLSVFESLHNVLTAMQAEGYRHRRPAPPRSTSCAPPSSHGNAALHGQPANVAARVPADDHRRAAAAGCARSRPGARRPGATRPTGAVVFILGRRFGNVFVGLQPVFGYEGDPMRLLFERALPRRMPSPPSTAGCARISAPMRCCISACMARWNSCPASRPAWAGLLARPADRQPAQHLPLCRQQPLRGDAGQAARTPSPSPT